MDFEDYQRQAKTTDKTENAGGVVVALMGLAGEAGSLLTEYKKHLRDGAAHSRFESAVAEELGDMLWYIATLASHMNIALEDIAMMNIAKTQERWGSEHDDQIGLQLPRSLPDEAYPQTEQIPRTLNIRFEETQEGGRHHVKIFSDDVQVGDQITDNAYDDDGYRYHDVFHLAYAAVLGWSPVLRKLLKRKRRSNPLVDEVEDGGRAQVIEEAVSAYVYQYAQNHAFLEGVTTVDYALLKTIKELTKGTEAGRATFRDWELAILEGFRVWRALRRARSGLVRCNLREGTIVFEPANSGGVGG